MTFSRTTWMLAVATALLALLLLLPGGSDGGRGDLPRLPEIVPDAVTRVTFTRQGITTVITREADERWRILQPLEGVADTAVMKSLLQAFKKPVPMDVRVDSTEREEYGVDDNEGVHFEVFTGGAEPVISMVVGRDVPGGSTLIRLAGRDDVYRARVGGRYRYDREPKEWRNHVLLDVEEGDVVGLTLEHPAGEGTFQREPLATAEEGAAAWGPWRLAEDERFAVDQRTLDALVRSVVRMRASEIHAPETGTGWERPDAVLEVATPTGGTRRVTFVEAPEGQAALARVDDNPDVYRVARGHLERVRQDLVQFADKTVLQFAREEVDSIALAEGSTRVRIRQDPGTQLWRVVEPVAMDPDLKAVLQAVNVLGSLRSARVAAGVSPAAAGLQPPTGRLEVRLVDGRTLVLEVGSTFMDGSAESVYVRRVGDATVHVLRTDALARIRQAFFKG